MQNIYCSTKGITCFSKYARTKKISFLDSIFFCSISLQKGFSCNINNVFFISVNLKRKNERKWESKKNIKIKNRKKGTDEEGIGVCLGVVGQKGCWSLKYCVPRTPGAYSALWLCEDLVPLSDLTNPCISLISHGGEVNVWCRKDLFHFICCFNFAVSGFHWPMVLDHKAGRGRTCNLLCC